MNFYDREQELAFLRETREAARTAAKFTVVTGRRRIGKTTLIKMAYEDTPFVYFFVARKAESELCETYLEEISEKLGIPTLGSSRSEMVVYVLYGEEIYTISHFSVDVFTKTQPMATVARYTVATPLNSLDSITVEKPEDSVRYAIVRMDDDTAANEQEGTEENTQYRCMKNGEEISYDAFDAAWERLLTVTVSGRLPGGWQKKETHTKYTLRTVSGGTHTIELSDYDGMHDAVTLDGHTYFYLIKGGMTELP